MATHGRGLICVPLTEQRSQELDLPLMVQKNTVLHETQFTVSVDYKLNNCTTGISAYDRAMTIQALADPKSKPQDFGKPGHIFPLIARPGGVLRRAGHTEAAIDLARLAGYSPVGVLVEILNEDGSMARLPELIEISKKLDIPIISIEDLINYRLKQDKQITLEAEVDLPTQFGTFKLSVFQEIGSNATHLSLSKGEITSDLPTLVRVHSSCITGDILHSLRCDCGEQLATALRKIEEEGKGVLVYLYQEGRGIGIIDKIKAYQLQDQGLDTVEANEKLGYPADLREYGIGAQILNYLNVGKIRLMTNNPKKTVALAGFGLEICETVPLKVESNPHNSKYLETKKNKLGHLL
jgi:3,4-dihydroxy 2-butanone 4-phosphate synthase/GTP cyclohydrolase II